MTPRTKTTNKARPVVGATLLLALLLGLLGAAAAGKAVAAPGDRDGQTAPPPSAGRAAVSQGAREHLGLDAQEVSRVLSDPELARQIPVGVKVGSGETQDLGPAAQSRGRERCKSKVYTLTVQDLDKKDLLRFTATKRWCYDGRRVTKGLMGPATTWVRPDARYDPAEPEPEGYAYDPASEHATEGFVRANGSDRGAHKSTRAGRFDFYFVGSQKPVGAEGVGISQIGRYNGGCLSGHYQPVTPTIDFGPDNRHGSMEANFEFSSVYEGTSSVSFQCSLDNGEYAPCSSPTTYSALAEGPHEFGLRAYEGGGSGVGNALPRPPAYLFRVDTNPPLVRAVTPEPGSTGVPAATNVTARFSKDMDEFSFFGNFVLEEAASGTPVDAAIFYDRETKTATLDPFADLQPGLRYLATVRGGEGGVVDRSGNVMESDKTWNFSVAPQEPPAP